MASAEQYELFAEASIADQAAAKHFGIAIGALAGLFILAHWTQKLAPRVTNRSRSCDRLYTATIRPFRRAAAGAAVGGVLVLPGRMLLASAYFAINIVLTFTNVNWTSQTLFAKRLGWMALCNLCIAVFLGLKNTPLSPLAGKSYESINVLHRCCGYTTVMYMALHSTIFITGLQKAGALFVLSSRNQYAAATAGVALLVILVSSFGFVQKRRYELFVTLHLILVVLVLATGESVVPAHLV
ncbi:hypothetical protein B0A55_00255 [Friedmanniomyces simplex]|uniref:Ferric oxidoreductase domain-containing protein n=1 Tax=Friedmanniomyces simplex TaxID=329884 RepID=A0A4U0Y1E2_9PEZI|nr:hypothetical protein B0A55_00255 [Friedmanniomyces simplex]